MSRPLTFRKRERPDGSRYTYPLISPVRGGYVPRPLQVRRIPARLEPVENKVDMWELGREEEVEDADIWELDKQKDDMAKEDVQTEEISEGSEWDDLFEVGPEYEEEEYYGDYGEEKDELIFEETPYTGPTMSDVLQKLKQKAGEYKKRKEERRVEEPRVATVAGGAGLRDKIRSVFGKAEAIDRIDDEIDNVEEKFDFDEINRENALHSIQELEDRRRQIEEEEEEEWD